MARIDTEAVSVVLARSLIEEGTVTLTPQKPKPLHLPVGSKLILVHAYEFEEASARSESFGFTLEATLAGATKQVETVLRDRPMVNDDVKGSISVAFRLDQPGRHTVTFAANSTYRIGSWTGKASGGDRREATGTLTVVVAPASP